MNGKTKGDWIKQSSVLLDEFKKNYELHGVTDYIFSDDTYNDSEEKIKRLYDEVYSKLPFKLNFTTYIRLDLMIKFPNTADYLQESGLKSALFGIETINHASGKAVGKGLDPKIQFEFLEEIKKNQFKNIQTHSGFIIGLPKDREDEIERLEEFIFSDKNKLDHCVVEPLFITPREFTNKNKSYYSEFDLEYEKYGYECYEQIENSTFTEVRWKNNITGMTFDKAFEFSRRINDKISKSDKFKFGGFAFGFFKSLGISESDILTLPKSIISQKYNLKKLLEEKKLKYRINLLNISNVL
jgi:coproporphyrinogen III oxidase-like Fe-S oxidoreductase